jgi:hypothetical protein
LRRCRRGDVHPRHARRRVGDNEAVGLVEAERRGAGVRRGSVGLLGGEASAPRLLGPPDRPPGAALIKKGCNPSQAIFLIKFVYEIGYTHQELSKLLEELNVSNEI